MKNYLQLQQFQPGDSRINFSPVQNALESYGAKTERFGQVQRQQEEQTYQRGRESKQDARQDEQFQMQRQEALGKRMFAFAQQPPDKRDPRVWSALLAEHQKYHPGDGADPDDLDVITGPDKFGKSYAAAFGGVAQDPMDAKMKQAELAYKQAQTSKLYADAKEGAADFGKAGTIVQGRDGKYYAVRFRADGTEQINPLEVGGQSVIPDRGVDIVGDTAINKTTGDEVRNVGDALERGEFRKGRGQDNADFVAKWPKVAGSFKSFLQKSDQVMPVIDRAIASVGDNTTGWGALLATMPASDARALQGDLATIKANLAFGELQDMRANNPNGAGLGAVTERELDLLSSVQASLDQLQEGVRVKENLQLIRQNWATVRQLREQSFLQDQERFRAISGAPQQQPTQTQTAPQQARPDPLGLFGGQ